MTADNQTLFSKDELAEAKIKLKIITARPINRAIWFHNSLQALLADVGRAQKERHKSTVFAVDTSEIVSQIIYGQGHFNAFTFGGLLADKDRKSSAALETFDRLVIHHLLEGRRSPFVLLDSYADELGDLRNNSLLRAGSNLSLLHEIEMDRFEGFNTDTFRRIKDYILSSGTSGKAEEEFELFRKQFLPHWQRDLLDKVCKADNTAKDIEDFVQNGNFVFVRPPSFGDRSLTKVMSKLNWAEFQQYIDRPDVRSTRQSLSKQLAELCTAIARNRKVEYLNLAAKRDGEALADIHILNDFIQQSGGNYRVELISRTPTLHNVIAALPPGRLKATLRHPLLIPDIYQFSAQALASIGDVATQIEGLIKPYLAEKILHTPDEEQESATLENVKDCAREIVPLLRDATTVQQSIESGVETVRALAKELTPKSKSGETSKQDVSTLFSQISLVFNLLSQNLEPLSKAAIGQLIERALATTKMEWQRSFACDQKLTFRFLFVENDQLCPLPFAAMRILGGEHTRLFHIHSTRWQNALKEKFAIDLHNKNGPFEAEIPCSFILEQLVQSFRDWKNSNKTDDASYISAERYGVDSALLAGMALASSGKIRTAISISTTILHNVTKHIRTGNIPPHIKKESLLAYRELLFFRHFCERQTAMREFFDEPKMIGFFRGSVERSFAQSQRDLDFAAYLSEVIETKIANVPSAPSGYGHLQDYRLRLAHMSGWMDMQLISLSAGEKYLVAADREDIAVADIRQRKNIWAGIGLAKEALFTAHRVKLETQNVDASAANGKFTRRYLANVEARFLQNYLLMFLIFLSEEGSPGMHVFLTPDQSITREKVLSFMDWQTAWLRYREIEKEGNLELRASYLIEPIASMIESIDNLRAEVDKSHQTNELFSQKADAIIERSHKIRLATANKIENMLETDTFPKEQTFAKILAHRLIERLRSISDNTKNA